MSSEINYLAEAQAELREVSEKIELLQFKKEQLIDVISFIERVNKSKSEIAPSWLDKVLYFFHNIKEEAKIIEIMTWIEETDKIEKLSDHQKKLIYSLFHNNKSKFESVSRGVWKIKY